jgi:hypothetical protein
VVAEEDCEDVFDTEAVEDPLVETEDVAEDVPVENTDELPVWDSVEVIDMDADDDAVLDMVLLKDVMRQKPKSPSRYFSMATFIRSTVGEQLVSSVIRNLSIVHSAEPFKNRSGNSTRSASVLIASLTCLQATGAPAVSFIRATRTSFPRKVEQDTEPAATRESHDDRISFMIAACGSQSPSL